MSCLALQHVQQKHWLVISHPEPCFMIHTSPSVTSACFCPSIWTPFVQLQQHDLRLPEAFWCSADSLGPVHCVEITGYFVHRISGWKGPQGSFSSSTAHRLSVLVCLAGFAAPYTFHYSVTGYHRSCSEYLGKAAGGISLFLLTRYSIWVSPRVCAAETNPSIIASLNVS